MPHEDGESLLAWIRTQPHLVATRVAIYSAAPEQDHAPRLLAAGAADFIPKPTPIPHLLTRVARLTPPNTLGLPTAPTNPAAPADADTHH
jgi:DNA-binding response OmpR family regulator